MNRTKFVVRCAIGAVTLVSFADHTLAAPITVQSYTYNGLYHVPDGSYLDNGAAPGTGNPDTELIDGQYPTIGLGTTYTDDRWIGFANNGDDGQPQPEITFNLGTIYDLNSLSVIYDVDHGPQIYAPDSVSVSFSVDNLIYTAPVALTGFDDTGNSTITRSTTFGLPTNVEGQFVRLSFYNDQPWTFLAEVSFDGQLPPPPAPEPSSILLLSLGALGLIHSARRPSLHVIGQLKKHRHQLITNQLIKDLGHERDFSCP